MKEKERGTVSVVMEHFNLSQQALLDAYMGGGLEPDGLLAGYAQGEEGHNIQCYAALLEYARLNPDRAVLCIRIRSCRLYPSRSRIDPEWTWGTTVLISSIWKGSKVFRVRVAARGVPATYLLLCLTDSDPRTGGQFNYGSGQV